MSSKVDIFERRAKELFPKEEVEEEQEDIFTRRAKQYRPPSVAKDIAKSGSVGGAKGLFGTYGNLLDLIRAQAKGTLPGEKIQRERESAAAERLNKGEQSLADLFELGEDEILPRYSRLPSGNEVEQFAEMLGVDTEPQTRAGRYAKRIGEAGGSGLSLGAGAGTLGALGAGATAGQTVEELGGSPTAGALTELLTSLGAGALKGKVLPGSKEAQELAQAGRTLGLTERELAPLLKGRRGFALGSTFTRKTERLKKFADSIENKLGDAFKGVREEAAKYGDLSGAQSQKLVDKLGKTLEKVTKTHNPSDAEKAAANILQEAISNIDSQGSSYEKLISSYRSINQQPKRVRNLLEPVKKAYASELAKASPELASDFNRSNRLYAQFMDRVSRMRPETFDKIINKAEAMGIGTGVLFAALGHPWLLKGILVESGLRSLSKQYLTNPYLQNLPNKLIHAIKNGKTKTAVNLIKEFKQYVKDETGQDISEEDLLGV